MLFFEKDQIILKASYVKSLFTVTPLSSSKERESYAALVAQSEETLARHYLRTSHKTVTVDDVKDHFINRGWLPLKKTVS